MNIHHLRHATMVLETDKEVILIDPMLGPVGTLPPFAFFRSKPKRNPTVGLPSSTKAVLERVSHCLITHNHPDHIDSAAIQFLKERQVPVSCSRREAGVYQQKGLHIVRQIDAWEQTAFLGGTLMGIPGRHGYGFVANVAGPVMGYFLALPNQPSVYVSSDTIYTDDVKRAVKELRPDLCVLAAGEAQFDVFKPLLMNMPDMLQFIADAPHKVLANHMDAINHCPTTREVLRNTLAEKGLLHKVMIPENGEVIPLP